MAFNLNKNDEAKKSSSGFNLSKQPVQDTDSIKSVPSSTTRTSSSKNWMIGLVALIIVGTVVWYYSSSKESTSIHPSKASDTIETPPAIAQVADSTTNPSQSTASPAEKKADVPQNEARIKTAKKVTLDRKIPVRFAKGSSAFRNMDQLLIRQLVVYLKENPEESIHVNGYASGEGSLEINQAISQSRADVFKKFLISKSVDENRITAIGKGIENPIASNEDNLGRKKNRRIEITFP